MLALTLVEAASASFFWTDDCPAPRAGRGKKGECKEKACLVRISKQLTNAFATSSNVRGVHSSFLPKRRLPWLPLLTLRLKFYEEI